MLRMLVGSPTFCWLEADVGSSRLSKSKEVLLLFRKSNPGERGSLLWICKSSLGSGVNIT